MGTNELSATEIKSLVAKKIKMVRAARNLTQNDLAKAIGRTIDTVSALERGKNFPGVDTFKSLSEALDVPIRDFFDFGPAIKSTRNKARDEQLAQILAVAQSLDDSSLELALEQIKVLANHKS
ncbi:helix-turn-helix transcriptional regulator [Terasakiella sp.]|uniref:helix-turn-helix transcriptional regulator n=1 Tax=Terasakiella sp. TaxID=2034861 RepID=UPI003AA9D69C